MQMDHQLISEVLLQNEKETRGICREQKHMERELDFSGYDERRLPRGTDMTDANKDGKAPARKRQPRVLAIHDISCLGSCSLTVALPVLSACGLEAVPLPTALLSTHTGEFERPFTMDMTGEMENILRHWEYLNLRFEGIYSGYFGNREQVGLTRQLIERYGKDTLVFVDPVMADNGSWYCGFDESFAKAMLPLIARADVITPNATEAAFLLGEKPGGERPAVPTEDQAMPGEENRAVLTEEILEERISRLLALGPKQVVITGVELPGTYPGQIGYYAGDRDGRRQRAFHKKIDHVLHGCGDVFASVLCGQMIGGRDFFEAVTVADRIVGKAIERTMESYEEHWYGLQFEQVLGELQSR